MNKAILSNMSSWVCPNSKSGPFLPLTAVSNDPQDFDIQPEETLLLEPGKYFIAFQIVGCDNEALQAFLAKTQKEQESWEMGMDSISTSRAVIFGK